MVVGSRPARREQRSDSHSELPTTDSDRGDTDRETSVDIGSDIGPDIGPDIGILGIPGLLPGLLPGSANTGIGGIGGMGIGMFQPQPTPFAPFTPYGLHIANAGIPDYTFAATPLLGQFGGGQQHVGANTARSAGGGAAGGDAGLVGGRGGAGGAGGGGGGSSSAHTFAAAPNSSNFHASASSGPAGMSSGAQGLGPSAAVPAGASDNSADFSRATSASSGIHPALFDIPIPVAVPHHHNHQHQHQHHHQQPVQQPHSNHQQHQQHHHQHIPQQHPHLTDRTAHHYKMSQHMDLDPNEPSQQETAMSDFEIQPEGPLVGEKVSSHAITEQYARADPTYVAKTMALPRTYSHYRPIQGDGNCGWRAIAFAYCEALVQYGNIDRVRDELQRLTNLNKYIEDVGGQDYSIFEFMVQATFDLFSDIILIMSEGNDPMPHLVTAFNDSQISQCLVYHFRLLACARLKGHSPEYESWLVGSVQDYLDGTVMPVNQEIDHICVTLVRDILLAPANIVLEIAYLDRSQGDEVNVHRFHEGATGQGPSASALTIYLLYRPGHYDILYRETPVSPPPAPVDIQIHRVSYPARFDDPIAAMQNTAFVDMSAISMIPGLASSSLPAYGPPSTAPPPMTGSYAASPGSHWDSQPLPPEVISAPPPSQPSPPQQEATVRFSKYNFRTLTDGAAESHGTYEPAFTTNTFKNSHYNTAHYNNLNFQPEMYQPDADEEMSNSGHSRAGGRKRSTDHCPGIKKEK